MSRYIPMPAYPDMMPVDISFVFEAGCNIVRFHQLDAEWHNRNLFSFTKGKLATTYADGVLSFHIGDAQNPACYYLIVAE